MRSCPGVTASRSVRRITLGRQHQKFSTSKRLNPCEYCEKSFEPNFTKQRFCSALCGSKSRTKDRARTCEHCGAQFQAARRTAHYVGRFCSRDCSFAFHAKEPAFSRLFIGNCTECNGLIVAKRKRAICSGQCRKKRNAVRSIEYYHSRPGEVVHGECEWCRKRFTQHRRFAKRTTKYCSPRCANAGNRKTEKIKRKRLIHNSAVEPVSLAYVMERDRKHCQLCGCKVRKPTAVWHPRMATLDHIRPLSQGGGHTRVNVQLACSACNSAKSNKFIGQLRLAG